MIESRIGGRTEAHADRGLRGAVVGYHGYPQLTSGALAPSAVEEPVVAIMLTFGEPAPAAQTRNLTAIPVPRDSSERQALLRRAKRGLQIDMTPMGASRLLGVTAPRPDAGDLDPNEVLGADIVRVLGRLVSAPTWAIRFAAVDTYLLERLKSAPPRSLTAGAAWRKFGESPGMLLVGELTPESAPDEGLPSPGASYDVHNAAADRMLRRYHRAGSEAPAPPG